MSTRKCTRHVIFCRVYLLNHTHEWLSRETLEYCSANYRAICVFSTLNANVIECRRLHSCGAVHQTLSHRRLWIAVALSVPSNKAYGMLRDIETSQLNSMKIYVVYPPYTRPYIMQLHVCCSSSW